MGSETVPCQGRCGRKLVRCPFGGAVASALACVLGGRLFVIRPLTVGMHQYFVQELVLTCTRQGEAE